jgi:hypothetical protein
MSDTLRMKAAQMAAIEHMTGDVYRVGCDLERELNAANSIIRQQQLLDEENLRLKQRIKRLEGSIEKLKDAGDLVFIWLLYNRSHLGGLDVDSALREWKQSKKEAKP